MSSNRDMWFECGDIHSLRIDKMLRSHGPLCDLPLALKCFFELLALSVVCII